MKSKLLSSMISMVGDNEQRLITIHMVIYKFMDCDLAATMLFEQLLYWTDRATIPGGWIAKSEKEWRDELHLRQYSIRRGIEVLRQRSLIETKIKRWNKFPTVHYRVKIDEVKTQWISFLRSCDFEITVLAKSQKGFDEIARTLTESTVQKLPSKQEQRRPSSQTEKKFPF